MVDALATKTTSTLCWNASRDVVRLNNIADWLVVIPGALYAAATPYYRLVTLLPLMTCHYFNFCTSFCISRVS